MYELAGGKGVVFSTSFSKTGAPGLRVGYMILPAGAGQADRGDRGVDVHRPAAASAGDAARVHPARPLRAESRRRLRSCSASVATPCSRASRRSSRRAPSWSHPDGGYFLWLDLPPGVKIDAAVRAGRRGGRPARQGHGLLRRTAAATSRPASRSASPRSTRSARGSAGSARSCASWPAYPRRALGRLHLRRWLAGEPAPRSESASSKVATGTISSPSAYCSASRAFPVGTTKMSAPACFAPITFCLMPPIGSTLPSSASSPVADDPPALVDVRAELVDDVEREREPRRGAADGPRVDVDRRPAGRSSPPAGRSRR